MFCKRIEIVLILLLLLNVTIGAYSPLYTKDGVMSDRLFDFSFAGYEYGEKELPSPPVSRTATGLDKTGKTDQTAALQAHVDATPTGGVLFVPAGKYLLRSPVYIKKRMIFRGAGMSESGTVFVVARSLFDSIGMGSCRAGTNKGWGWCGGYLWLNSKNNRSGTKATITRAAKRHDSILTVDTNSNLGGVGAEIMIEMVDDADQGTMKKYFYGNQPLGTNTRRVTTRGYVGRVKRLIGNNQIEIEPPLPCDVMLSWKPVIKWPGYTIDHVGFENFAMEMATSIPYPGHHKGFGWNGISLTSTRHSFIRNVRVVNADSAFLARSSDHVTLDNVVIESTRGADSRGDHGHHAVDLTGNSYALVKNSNFKVQYTHDITVDGYLNLNVITSTQFHRLSADHHGNAPYANLFDALSTTTYDHLWNSGGSTTALPNAGSRGVFWNVRRVGSSQVPPAPYFARSADRYKYPSIVMVPGEQSSRNTDHYAESQFVEPESLYFAQLAKRLGRPAPVPAPTPAPTSAPCNTVNLDPSCENNLRNAKACCPASCGQCGGSGCSSFPGGANSCCHGPVSTSGVSCNDSPPPCVIQTTPIEIEKCSSSQTCVNGKCVDNNTTKKTTITSTNTPQTTPKTIKTSSISTKITTKTTTTSANDDVLFKQSACAALNVGDLAVLFGFSPKLTNTFTLTTTLVTNVNDNDALIALDVVIGFSESAANVELFDDVAATFRIGPGGLFEVRGKDAYMRDSDKIATVNQRYTVKMVVFLDEKLFSLQVDDVLVANKTPFRSTASTITSIGSLQARMRSASGVELCATTIENGDKLNNVASTTTKITSTTTKTTRAPQTSQTPSSLSSTSLSSSLTSTIDDDTPINTTMSTLTQATGTLYAQCHQGQIGCECLSGDECVSGLQCKLIMQKKVCVLNEVLCENGDAGCPCADNQSCGRETLSCSVGAGKCLYDSVNNDGKCQEDVYAATKGCPCSELGECVDNSECIDAHCVVTSCQPGTIGCKCDVNRVCYAGDSVCVDEYCVARVEPVTMVVSSANCHCWHGIVAVLLLFVLFLA